jgi:branched-chain amino acid transport system permease protein
VLTLTPAIVDFSEMARIIIIVVIGGIGHFIGPVLAAPPINFLSTYLQAFGEWSLVLFAAIVIVVMRSYPAGLVGLFESLLRRWRRREKG